ncbi:MAG TPA: RNA-binding S4 domain-containing protein [Pseudolysinimonas sp.]|nr:RNA-binding S4 domain-containing protein [Pseudolysinimonas sp.]
MTDARVDSWLWAVRLVKTRSMATALCRAGHVRLNGERAKAAQHVKPGDEVQFRVEGGPPRIVVVRQLFVKRVGAPVAATAYEDNSPPPPPPEERLFTGVRDRGAGRPTKRDRREIEKLLGRG